MLGCGGKEDVPSPFSWLFNVVAGGGSPWEKPGSACTHMTKVGHLQPFYLFLSRLGCSLDELQDVWPDKFCQAKHPEDQNPASICGQDMELLMTESHMHVQDIKSSPHLLPRTATEVCLPSG